MNIKIDIEKYVNLYIQEKKEILNNYPIDKVTKAVELVFDSYIKEKTQP